MQTALDCIPCFQEQALRAARAAGATEDVVEQVLREVVRGIAAADWDATPIELGMPVHRAVREITGVDDPFAEDKRRSTEQALQHYEHLQAEISAADDPLRMAVAASIAGNLIDLAAHESYDMDATVASIAEAEFAIDDLDELESSLGAAQSLLLFADNAGEIVFDRLLLETIASRWSPRISVVVKSGPFINDATARDARQAGIDRVPGVRLLEVSNGDDDTSPAYVSQEVARWLADHDVSIAKGQANYEALSDRKGVFLMLVAKCPCIAESLRVEVGDIILKLNRLA
ncbi:MAG: ARMT1-like domain-containing protein [Armatimonadota bacterium]|nr:ARMT1-like domain-containing protein [Armatimonadota bacterium]